MSAESDNATAELLQQMRLENRDMRRTNQAMMEMIQALTAKLNLGNTTVGNSSFSGNTEMVMASISGRIETFRYAPEEDETFDAWYNRYGMILTEDGKSLEDAARVRLLIGKLGASEFRKFSDTMLPQEPYSDTYDNSVSRLKKMFAPTRTLFTKRYDCFQTRQDLGQSLQDFAAQVNAKCERAQLPIDVDTMKCLIFICGLLPEQTEIRSKCLQVLEHVNSTGKSVSLDGLLEECNKFAALKENLAKLNQSGANPSLINKVHFKPKSSTFRHKQQKHQPKRPADSVKRCNYCGYRGHSEEECYSKKRTCFICHQTGHSANDCPRSNQKQRQQRPHGNSRNVRANPVSTGSLDVEQKDIGNSQGSLNSCHSCLSKTGVISNCLTQGNQGFYVNLNLNCSRVQLLIDTGAEETIISESLWKKIGSPRCQPTNRYGKGYTGHAFGFIGTTQINVKYKDEPEIKLTAYVTRNSGFKSLIGRPWLVSLKFLNRIGQICGGKNQVPVNSLVIGNYRTSNSSNQCDLVKTENCGPVDVHSRLIADKKQPDDEIVIAEIFGISEDDNDSVVVNQCDVLPVTAAEIAEETAKDDVMQKCIEFIKFGWPKKAPTGILSAFASRSKDLSLDNNCIVLGDRIVIPASLQSRMLKTLHFGHPGIVRMKAIARQHVYWPGIDSDVERTVRECVACTEHARNPRKHELKPWKPENFPWNRVHIDYAGPFHNKMYLIVVDAFSKWPEIYQVSHANTTSTIEALTKLFVRYGLPENLVTDNGTPFTSRLFEDFCASNGVSHVRTAPYHPQSNGQAERFVDTFKRTMSKIGGEDVHAALRAFLASYRNTPNAALSGNSPAEIFLRRKIRTQISLVHPKGMKILSSLDGGLNRESYVSRMVKNFNDHHGTTNRKFQLQDSVFYKSGPFQKRWLPGKVIRQIGATMYEIQRTDGSAHRYHANQLRRRWSDVDLTQPVPELLRDQQAEIAVVPEPQPEPHQVRQPTPEPEPLRRSQRCRMPVRRLDPDPKKKYYN